MQFEVWIACKVDCENFEAARAILLLEDPLSAIAQANIYRDQTHETWITVLE